MKISIEYLEKESLQSSEVCLGPEEYFDPIEDDEKYESDAIPKYDHACDYLDISKNRLIWTKLNVCGTSEDKKIITHYFNDGEVCMIHRKDVDGYEEIIHSTQVDEKTCHIIRTHKDGNKGWKVNYNAVIYDQDDGSQKEVRYDRM